MLKDAVAVIDVGTSKFTGLVGENGVNNNFRIHAYSEVSTYAISSGAGEIDSPEDFRSTVLKILDDLENSSRAKISKVYIGVPGDFLAVRNSSMQMYLNRCRRLKKRDVEEYLDSAKKNISVPDYEYITCSGVSYFLDGQKRATTLIGQVTESISGMTSFYYAKKSFVKLVKDTLFSAGVKDVSFVPVPLAESLLLFTESERFAFEVLLDVGSSITHFSLLYGGGVLFNTSFDIGGGYITAYLMNRFDLPTYELAEKLKRKLNLTLPADFNGIYEVTDGKRLYRYHQRSCNEVAEYVITSLAEKIDNALKDCKMKLPSGFALSLTGGGIAYIRGAREFLFNTVEIPVNVVYPKISYMSKPEETSKIALLNYALNYKGV